MGINGNVSSTNFFLTSLVHGIGIQPETGDSHGPYPEGVYGAHLPTTSICPSGNRAAVGLYITLMISASPGRISSGIAPDYAVFVPVRAVAWPTFTGPQGIRSEEEPAPSPLTSLSWKTTRTFFVSPLWGMFFR